MVDVRRLFTYTREESIKLLLISILILAISIIISSIFAIFSYTIQSVLSWFVGLIIFIWIIGVINLYDRIKNIKNLDWVIIFIFDLFSYLFISIFIGFGLVQLILETLIYMILVWLYSNYREYGKFIKIK
ncbi:hypothetical protein YN1_8880 [Nanoarchaeota archaeon]